VSGLRDVIADAIGPAFLEETGTTWLYDKGRFVADTILAIPGLADLLVNAANLVVVDADYCEMRHRVCRYSTDTVALGRTILEGR